MFMAVIDYLLSNGEPWLQYCVRINLLQENRGTLAELKEAALQDKKIKAYLHDISHYHGQLVSNHKNPELPIHKLHFLLNIGFDTSIPEIQIAINEIMKHKDENGVYHSLTNIPKHYGGTGEDTFGWCLCDAPLLLSALAKAGVSYKEHIKQGADYLANLPQMPGYPCSVSEGFGKFRGPGRKDDCCPNATLIMLRLFAELPEYRDTDLANKNIDAILTLWEVSLERHPYMFYMGTDFRKLKAPAMWYDIVSVTDCLSQFEYAKKDSRFKEMLDIIRGKQTEEGLFIPEAVYQKFKGWDFGQKKTPSPYLTFLCTRIFERVK